MHKCGMDRIWKVGQEPMWASNVAMLHAELEVQWHKFEHDDSASAPFRLVCGSSRSSQCYIDFSRLIQSCSNIESEIKRDPDVSTELDSIRVATTPLGTSTYTLVCFRSLNASRSEAVVWRGHDCLGYPVG